MEIIAFGSRITADSKPYSDLDLALKGSISLSQESQLEEKFSNSEIPYKIDLVIYSRASDDFKKIIDQKGVSWSK